MVDPINYAGQLGQAQALVPDYQQQMLRQQLGALQTQQVGLQNRQIEAETRATDFKTQQTLVATQQQEEYTREVEAAIATGDPRLIARTMARYPGFADQTKAVWDRLDSRVRDADLRDMGQIYAAASGGRYDLAATALRRRIEADKAADGQADPNDEQILTLLQSSDPAEQKRAAGMVGFSLASITGPEKFGSTFGTLSEGEAGFTLSPGSRRYDRDGKIIAEAPFAPRTITVGEGQTVVEYDPNMGGGGPASGGGGVSGSAGAPSGRTQFGWTPRARNGGDNSDADVDNKISGMARNLGVGATTPFPAGMSNLQIAKALALSEGGAGSLADRNNNPGNLRDPKTGAYRKFPSKEAGLQAAAAQVARNRARGQTTIATMVEGLPVGGGSAGGGQPGGRVIAEGAPKQGKAPAARMSPAEVKAEGLDPQMVYYRGEDGVPKAVSGQSKNAVVNLTEAQSKATGYLNSVIAATNALNSVRGYKPSEIALGLDALGAGNPFRRNLSQVDRRVLNAQLAFSTAVLRLESGAVVSPQEAAQKAKTLFPMPGDGPEAQADKRAQREAAIRALRTASGPGSQTVGRAAPAGGKQGGEQPVRVRSVQEAQKLPAGTTFIAPNGRTYRKK